MAYLGRPEPFGEILFGLSLVDAPLFALFGLSPIELLVVGLIMVLLFGSRLPDALNSLRRSIATLRTQPIELPRQRAPEGFRLGQLAKYIFVAILGAGLAWAVLALDLEIQ